MFRIITIVIFVALMAVPSFSQDNFAEVRVSRQYQYADYAYTKDQRIVEAFFTQVPGQSQMCAGVGYQFKTGKGTVSTMIYGVVGSNGQLGIMPAVMPAFEYKGIKSTAFLGWFVPVKGKVHEFLVLDTWDTTKTLGKRLEAGVSLGFFLQDKKWNPQYGPLVRVNDKRGAWSVSYRVGTGRELRVSRTLIF